MHTRIVWIEKKTEKWRQTYKRKGEEEKKEKKYERLMYISTAAAIRKEKRPQMQASVTTAHVVNSRQDNFIGLNLLVQGFLKG